MQGFQKISDWNRNLRARGSVFVQDTARGDVYCPEKEAGLTSGGSKPVRPPLFFPFRAAYKTSTCGFQPCLQGHRFTWCVCVCVWSFLVLIALASPSTSYICSHLLVNLPSPSCCNCLLSRLTCASTISYIVRFGIWLLLKVFFPAQGWMDVGGVGAGGVLLQSCLQIHYCIMKPVGG